MTPLDFLAEVLPSSGDGYYCVAELTKKKEHKYIKDIGEAQEHIDRWLANECDIFFGLATFKEAGKREAVNADKIKALFIDMDGYPSKKAAALALDEFLKKTGLDTFGAPWVVASGGGIHCYWLLTEELPIATWKPVAENLKRLCKQEGMSIDMTVTADAARVLRIPGTKNFKKKYGTPRPVKLMSTGGRVVFADMASAIESQLTEQFKPRPIFMAELSGQRPKRDPNATQVKLLENAQTSFEQIWDKTEAGTGCAQIKAYVENPQEDGLEPIWRGLLSWAKVCEDGPAYAEWLTDMHPYDRDRMHQKLAEIKGPYPCTKMDSENPGVCASCPNWGKVTNPLILGRKIRTDNTEKQIVINHTLPPPEPEPQPDPEYDEMDVLEEEVAEPVATYQQVVTRPQPPRGFSYGAAGGVYKDVETTDANGNKTTKQAQVLAYDLFAVDILKQEGEHIVHLAANRPDGAVTVIVPQKAVVSKDETVKTLAAQNIIASYGKGNDANLFDYVRACVEEASMTKKAIPIPTQLGWQEDGSFVYNNRVFGKDGSETTVPMPGLENINRNTNSAGTLAKWRKPWDLLAQRKMNTMLALAMDSFGCALFKFTDYAGFVWHIGSTESGTGKSLTLELKAGVWGHITRYRTSKGTSPVAMQNRAGLLNSTPLLIDEITSKSRKDMEWAPEFVFDLAEGQGKDRMESGANKERMNNSVWALTCTMTSNVHLTDYMSGARKHSSNGELLRMLEWTPNVAIQWADGDRPILKNIKSNYGVAGEAWVRWLVTHQEEAQEVVAKVHERLKEVMGFVDDERYWHAACTTTVAAAILTGPKHANILNAPVKGIVDALHELVDKARGTLRKNVRTAEDVLNAYTREYYGNFIVIRKGTDRKILAGWGSGETIDASITKSKVLGRVEQEVLADGYVEYFLEEQLLKQHCVSMSFGYADFKAQLEAMWPGNVHYTKKDMLSRTNGPGMRVNVMHITRRKEALHENTVSVDDLEEA